MGIDAFLVGICWDKYLTHNIAAAVQDKGTVSKEHL